MMTSSPFAVQRKAALPTLPNASWKIPVHVHQRKRTRTASAETSTSLKEPVPLKADYHHLPQSYTFRTSTVEFKG
ncbi:hypothetical protein Y032_0545g3252 [Ancylostoma ceylanicum]|uniref:Uncharacterized protein n=1 Tax=Ancylostoma ceylanicum TaxID=53326 RepID=A0A016WSV6_9BILA|nr:hypothetical protein Y032_0545g3252 [Ancylostoma ceylanicum]